MRSSVKRPWVSVPVGQNHAGNLRQGFQHMALADKHARVHAGRQLQAVRAVGVAQRQRPGAGYDQHRKRHKEGFFKAINLPPKAKSAHKR